MSVISNTALAFSMSADAFAASISKGVALKKPRLRDAMRVGAIFGIVETLTPLIGWAIGLFASRFVEAVDHWVAFVILAIVGGKMLYEGLSRAEEERREAHSLGVLILTAIGTSIDAMAVGVTLALIDIDIWMMAAMIGAATFVMATIGIMTGHYLGTRVGKMAEIFGGVCLIAIGLKILLEHLGYITL